MSLCSGYEPAPLAEAYDERRFSVALRGPDEDTRSVRCDFGTLTPFAVSAAMPYQLAFRPIAHSASTVTNQLAPAGKPTRLASFCQCGQIYVAVVKTVAIVAVLDPGGDVHHVTPRAQHSITSREVVEIAKLRADEKLFPLGP